MSKDQMKRSKKEQLEKKATTGEEVVPGGKGGLSLDAQKHSVEGRKKGGEARKANMTHEDYQEMGKKGGQTRKSGDEEDDDKEGGDEDYESK